jgi:two-component system CheB/CheR fusion protein
MATEKPARKAGRKTPARPSLQRNPLASPPPPAAKDKTQRGAVAVLPIVGIGASAGGLEAFEAFFRACPEDSGMAFVLVPHLDPGHESLLTEILQRSTAMPVVQALDQIPVAANHVYIIPPNREMTIFNGVLQLAEPTLARGQRMPIDAFLCSLAEDQAAHAIGVILSGTATDGTLGLRAIHGAGGICMVQEPTTAKYDGMPQSAIAAGVASHILTVEQMPALLVKVTQLPNFLLGLTMPRILPAAALSNLNQILMQVHKNTGHDFSLYKKSTLGRRIERRMAQQNIGDMAVYARFLKENLPEVKALFKEMLISVTSFFRDPEAFLLLKQEILPTLLVDKPADYVFRAWVAGCASGEEAYSIAIVLSEFMEEKQQSFKVQIYATDLDDDAIDTARSGRYPSAIAQDVSPERLRRFFIKDESEPHNPGYKIKPFIREMVVFAVQSVIKDPPFTKLDLLSCRNLMIYLEQEQQARLIPNFHYALKPGGVLLLSSSESITHHPELFQAINRKWKFYRASKTTLATGLPSFGRATLMDKVMKPPTKPVLPKTDQMNIADLSNRILLQSYAPASVTTDARGNILHVHGDTSRYLRPPTGPVTTNVIEMAREGLQLDLRAAISAAGQGTPTQNQEVSLNTDSGSLLVRISVRLLPTPQSIASADERLLLVSFQDVAAPVKRRRRSQSAATTTNDAARIEYLERELAYSKENLQAINEEQQATNEELKSANEELQATNEELQSSNEELETSKEELQSLNEETITVNAELNSKVEQLNDYQNDLKNLFDNVNAGTLLLDHHLILRRYTREAAKVYCLVATDIGRPLVDIKSNLEGGDLLAELQSVLDTLIPCEREVRSNDGTWYLARIQPYRTLDNVIDGVVLTFTDITENREARQIKLAAVQLARELAEGIVDSVNDPMIVLDGDLQVVSASHSFYEHFQVKATETVGRKIYELGNGQWKIPALRELIENVLPNEQAFKGFVVEHDFPGLGPRRMVLNARRIVTAIGNTELILLAMVAIESLEKS